VVGGGPCAFNPEPIADFFDAVLIGEGEEAIGEIVAAHRAAKAAGHTREETVAALAQVRGVYVPSLYESATTERGARPRPGVAAPPVVAKRVLRDLDSVASPACPIVPFMEVVHDRATVGSCEAAPEDAASARRGWCTDP